MNELTDHQLIAMIYTMIDDIKNKQQQLEKLKEEAEKRKLL